MGKKFTKMLSFLMAMVLTFSLFTPITAEASSGTIGDSKKATYTFDPATGIFTLTGTYNNSSGAMGTVDYSYYPQLEVAEGASQIKIMNATLVGDMAGFVSRFDTLQSITFTNVNTSQVYVYDQMFNLCSSLQRLDLSCFDTSNAKSMIKVFFECKSLKYLDISSWVIPAGIKTDKMFENCYPDTIKAPKSIGSNISLPRTYYDEAGNSYITLTSACAGKTLTLTNPNQDNITARVELKGDFRYDEKIVAVVTGAEGQTLSYQWKRGNDVIGTAKSSFYYPVEADIGQLLSCTVTSSTMTGYVVSPAVMIMKTWGDPAPTGLAGVAPSSAGAADGKITRTNAYMEYSNNPEFKNATPCTGSEVTGLRAGTYYVRYAEDNVREAGEAATVVVGDGTTVVPTLTGTVKITGTLTYGETLTATVSNSNNTGRLYYQWLRGGNVISGADGSTYKLEASDVGKIISCEVSGSNEQGVITGTAGSAVSKAAGPSAPTGLAAVAPSGPDVQDGQITGVDMGMEYSTTSDFKTKTACTGSVITGLASGTYYVRTAESAVRLAGASEKIVVPEGVVSALTGTVTITGTPKYGQILRASLTNTNNTGTLYYQWKRDGVAISGAVAASYAVAAADVGTMLSCEIKSSRQTGSKSGFASSMINKADAPAAPTGLAAVKTSAPGAADGKITGTTAAMEYSTSTSFSSSKSCAGTTVTGLKAGTYYVRVAETATTKAGAYTFVKVEDGTAVVLRGTVTVSGTAKYGQTLTVTVSNSNNTGTLSYQWMRGNSTIAGATSATYTLTSMDIGTTVSCVVTSSALSGSISGSASQTVEKADGPAAPTGLTVVKPSIAGASDGQIIGTTNKMEYSTASTFTSKTTCPSGNITGLKAGTYYVRISETTTTKAGSAARLVIADGEAALSGTVTISGTAKYGQTLTAKVSNTNNTGSLSYQWKRDGSKIVGATASTYTITASDIDTVLSCDVKSSVQVGTISGSASKKVVKADAPAAPTGLAAVKTTAPGASDGKITGTTNKMEYSRAADFNGKLACTGTTITGLEAGTYYVRIAETTTTKAGAATTVVVEDSIPALTGTVTISGTPQYGNTLTAKLSGYRPIGTLTYQWKRGTTNISGATSSTYKVTAEDFGQTLKCVVKCTVETGSLSSNTVSVAMEVPTVNLTARATGILVNWTATPGAEGYYVYRKVKGGSYEKIKTITKGTTVNYVDKTAPYGATYYYTVKAYAGTAKSGVQSASINWIPFTPTVKVAYENSAVTITWNKILNVDGYYVYRKTGDGAYVKLKTITTGSCVSYVDKTAKAGKTYTYTVKAYAGTSKSKIEGVNITIPPATPVVTAVSKNGCASVKWGKISGAEGYYVYRKQAGGSYEKVGTVIAGQALSFYDKNVVVGETYSYAVKAYVGTVKSDISGVEVTIIPATPVVTLTDKAGCVVVNWNEIVGAEGYYVYRKEGSGSYQTLATIKSGSTVKYVDRTAVVGKTYTYTVKAYKGSVKSLIEGVTLTVTK